MPGKSQNYQKLVKYASNLASFYDSHIDGIVPVKQIDLELARRLKKYENFIKMSSDFNITISS